MAASGPQAAVCRWLIYVVTSLTDLFFILEPDGWNTLVKFEYNEKQVIQIDYKLAFTDFYINFSMSTVWSEIFRQYVAKNKGGDQSGRKQHVLFKHLQIDISDRLNDLLWV